MYILVISSRNLVWVSHRVPRVTNKTRKLCLQECKRYEFNRRYENNLKHKQHLSHTEIRYVEGIVLFNHTLRRAIPTKVE